MGKQIEMPRDDMRNIERMNLLYMKEDYLVRTLRATRDEIKDLGGTPTPDGLIEAQQDAETAHGNC